jgi:hypothetical protein
MPEASQIDDDSNAQEQSSPAPWPELPNEVAPGEDLALAQLKNRDLSADEIVELTRNPVLMKSRKVRIAVASHPHTARRIALRLIRELYTFELMRFALMPAAAADLRRVADEQLVARLASVGLGERISLARRSSAMVAAALLLDKEKRVWQPALENPRMTEAAIVRAIQVSTATPDFVGAVCRHAKWSLRAEIRVALLRNAHTPLARALEFARGIPAARLRDILHTSRLPERVKDCLKKSLAIDGTADGGKER